MFIVVVINFYHNYSFGLELLPGHGMFVTNLNVVMPMYIRAREHMYGFFFLGM